MSTEYDARRDGLLSYEAAIEALYMRQCRALASLEKAGISAEIRDLLVFGNKRLGIAPGALHNAISAAIRQERGGAE